MGDVTAGIRRAPALAALFTDDVLARLRRERQPTGYLRGRLNILEAPDQDDSPDESQGLHAWRRAQRNSWNDYVAAISQHGLLDDDLRSRLTGIDDSHFRGAMAECMVAWLLAEELRLPTQARPPGRKASILDFGVAITDGLIKVETKSPFVEMRRNGFGAFDYRPVVAGTLFDANKQFEKNQANVLVIAPLSDNPFLTARDLYVRAFIGENRFVMDFDPTRGRAVGPARAEFFANGQLVRLWPDTPRYTRVGAVVGLRERIIEDGGDLPYVRRSWFVLHNPHAQVPISTELWGNCPQLVRDGDSMRWTDGSAIFDR